MGIYSQPEIENEILNEVYFGDEVLRDAQDALSRFRRAAMQDDILAIGTQPELLEFNREMEKAFGFKTFSLYVSANFGDQNAFTIPISIAVEVAFNRNLVKKTSKGFKYSEKAKACVLCVIYSEIILNPRLNDKQVMSIILHEIGHNFSFALTNRQLAINFIRPTLIMIESIIRCLNYPERYNLTSTLIVSILQRCRFGYEVYAFVYNIVCGKVPVLKNMINLFTYLKSIVFYLPSKFLRFINSFRRYTGFFVPSNYISLLLIQEDEQLADNFVTMYGYGPEYAKALDEMSYHSDPHMPRLEKAPKVIRGLLGLYFAAIEIPHLFLEGHPTTPQRVKYQLKYLKDELNNDENLDPKMRKEIEMQIEDISRTLNDDFYRSDRDAKDLERRVITMLGDVLGSEPKDALLRPLGQNGNNINRRIQKRFDKMEML